MPGLSFVCCSSRSKNNPRARTHVTNLNKPVVPLQFVSQSFSNVKSILWKYLPAGFRVVKQFITSAVYIYFYVCDLNGSYSKRC
ncbi:hypothetical protein NQ317_017283 [Molorchus minor]|uniref:Uncharacterized protein n=1 Tax=Molorchus minor TaxID=1323400 RepID=A0ABQ9JTQ1_9CUCU|nr:hypothetical protein NQ317_017283 [Molorchus minor]